MFRPYVEMKRVIVNLKTGTVFRAVAYSHKGPWLILRQAEMLSDRGTPAASKPRVDGEVLVHLNELDFVQIVS